MNAKQITIKNIQDNGYVIGKTIKGKGLEIFEADSRVFYSYNVSKTTLDKELDKHKNSNFYVESYKLKNDKYYSDLKTPINNFSIDLDNLDFLSIKKEGSFIGYISLSKYKSDRDDQIKLCRDLLKLEQIKTRDEVFESYYDIDYDDSIKSFKSDSNSNYWDGDYILKHGNNICEIQSDCIYFDGRMDNYNNSVMDYYEFDEGECLKDIDPEESICVYNRKYKDWYIGYSLNQRYMNISYKQIGYNYDKDDCDEEELFFITYKEDEELLDKVKDFLKTEKEDLEMRSFINNELDDYYDYRNTSFSIPSLEFVFEDLADLNDQIRDNIDWDYSKIKSNFQKTLSDLLDKAILIDEKFIATINGSKYKQLRKLYKLGKVMDFELVKTAVSSEDSNISWAIKRGDEEYHFSPLNLIYFDEEGEQDVKEFAENALHAIEKRKIAKLSEKELYEKASRVFISVEDSLKSGNCKFGTETFIARHGIDLNKIGGIRGDYLLNIEKSNFTTRAVQYAIQRAS